MTDQVGGGVLDADNARQLRQTEHSVIADIGDRSAGHIVDQQRQIDFFGDRSEMPVQAFL